MFISLVISGIVSAVFLGFFPAFRAALAGLVMPPDIVPAAGLVVNLIPYFMLGGAIFLVITLVRHKVNN